MARLERSNYTVVGEYENNDGRKTEVKVFLSIDFEQETFDIMPVVGADIRNEQRIAHQSCETFNLIDLSVDNRDEVKAMIDAICKAYSHATSQLQSMSFQKTLNVK